MAKTRKSPAGQQPNSFGQPISVRYQDEDGSWGYADEVEGIFAVHVLMLTGRDLTVLDALLDDPKYWSTPALLEARSDILRYRADALMAHKRRQPDLAMAEARCAFLAAEIAKLYKLAVPKADAKIRSERNLRPRDPDKPTHEDIREVRGRLTSDQATVNWFRTAGRTVSLKTVQRAMRGHRSTTSRSGK